MAKARADKTKAKVMKRKETGPWFWRREAQRLGDAAGIDVEARGGSGRKEFDLYQQQLYPQY